ncbi:MAG: NUDIX hydrolase [Verrucomicrobiales bacterium]|nr:NUDIX hydrolase [Verrucomicrobiales bacterium]
MSVAPWPTIRSEDLGGFRIFHLRRDFKRSPRTGQEHDFFVLECPGWVNVIALTPDRRIILVEQRRHGTESLELEIPGGVMDPRDEGPIATAVRELREETGYEGRNARLLNSMAANPAIQNNLCHAILIEDCELRHPTDLDSGEDLVTQVRSLDEIPSLVHEGRIRHSLVLASLYYFELDQRRRSPAP